LLSNEGCPALCRSAEPERYVDDETVKQCLPRRDERARCHVLRGVQGYMFRDRPPASQK
jgi:hypothetical protein